MPNIRSTTDWGNTWYHNGKCYSLVGYSPGEPTASPLSGDNLYVAPVTFVYDDDWVEGGNSHRTWTSCEMCVSKLLSIHYKENVPQVGDSWKFHYRAPVNGVIRMWDYSAYGDYNYPGCSVRINGIDMGGLHKDNARSTLERSAVYRLIQNDTVTINIT